MNQERLMVVLREPKVSEKTTILADKFNQFTFKVMKNATKSEIKYATEQIFNVKVKDVHVLNVKGKKKRFKQLNGQRSDWKKACVTLQQGYDINLAVLP